MRIQGEFRVRLVDDRALLNDWRCIEDPFERREAREFDIQRGLKYDSGWVRNVVTDFGRRRLAATLAWSALLNQFIHGGSNSSNVRLNALQFTYPGGQTPAQIASPDTTTLDGTLLLQTRDKLFAPPASPASRTIGVVGICSEGVVSTDAAIQGVCAYTKLSTPVVQDGLTAADVTYRVTWSLDS